jgi:hypothetical protein
MSASGGIGNVKDSGALVEMAMGYARSRALCAAARLEIADVLAQGKDSVDELAIACQADPASLRRLLRALATFGIVAESSPDRFVLTPLGAPLRKAAPDSVWPAVVFWADLLADSWSYLTECVRTGTTSFEITKRAGIASRWSTAPDAPAIFRAVMGTAPAEDYMPLARAWDFSDSRVAADLGGGGGSLILAILNLYPEIRGMLVERPESIDRAAPRFTAEGLASRCDLLTADLRESVPAGADVYLLKHVLHGYNDDAATGVLQNCRSVIPDDGFLLVIEFVLPEVFDRVDKELELRAMSDLNMLAVTGGKERSAAEWKRLLLRARFEVRRIIAVPGEAVSIIEAAPSGRGATGQ